MRLSISLLALLPAAAINGAITGELTSYYPSLPATVESDTLHIVVSDTAASRLTFHTRASVARFTPTSGKSKQSWTVGLAAPDGSRTAVTFHYLFPDFDTPPSTVVLETSEGREIETAVFSTKPSAYNTIVLDVDISAKTLTVSGGCKEINEIAVIPLELPAISHAFVTSDTRTEVAMMALRTYDDPTRILATGLTKERLSEKFSKSVDPVEGYWVYLDRINSPDFARLGGKYTLAVIASESHPHAYDIIYIDGAEVNSSAWTSMLLKGQLLTLAGLAGVFSMIWYDSEFNQISDECHATLSEDGTILTLDFPLLETSLRFVKASR